MPRRLSPAQLKSLRDMIRRRRVLDVGHPGSQFIGAEFSRYSASWTVVGRNIPAAHAATPPHNLAVVPQTFDTWTERPPPTEFDVVILPFPSNDHPQDAACLEWSTHPQVIVFFGHPSDNALCGSPGFWDLAGKLKPDSDARDLWSRMMVMHKPSPEEEKEEEDEHEGGHGHHPKKGERYKLASSFKWPDKKPGDKAPIVEIMKDWTKGSGTAKIVGKGDVIHVRKTELAAKM